MDENSLYHLAMHVKGVAQQTQLSVRGMVQMTLYLLRGAVVHLRQGWRGQKLVRGPYGLLDRRHLKDHLQRGWQPECRQRQKKKRDLLRQPYPLQS